MDIRIDGVCHSYSVGSLALADIDLTLRPGITGLLGANGAGKTTLLRIAAGALKPWRGTLLAGDVDLYGKGRRGALRRVAWMPQTAGFPRSLSAIEFVTYVTWLRGHSWRRARAQASAALDAVELGAQADKRMGRLSGGMVRRVWLAQALAADADVILLDEPSTGLDPRQRATMVRLLAKITDRTVLLSSHILEDVAELAERVIVLDEGRVTVDGPTPDGLDAQWFLNHTRRGES